MSPPARRPISDLELAVMQHQPGAKGIVFPSDRTFAVYHVRCVPGPTIGAHSGRWLYEANAYLHSRRMTCVGCGGNAAEPRP